MNEASFHRPTLIDEKELPHDKEAEKAILGAVILDNSLIEQLTALLVDEDLYLESHRLILQSMVNLSEQNMGIDVVTIQADLARRGVLNRVGGFTFLASLIDGVPRTDNIEYYARVVRYRARERQAILTLHQAITRVLKRMLLITLWQTLNHSVVSIVRILTNSLWVSMNL